MAKDVDLSSQEWTSVVFEGKNKEFGAYQLRQGSTSRHNIATIIVVCVVVVLLVFLSLFDTIFPEAEEDATAVVVPVEQAAAIQDEEDQKEEDIVVEYEEPEPIVQEANSIQVTEFLVVEDSKADTTKVVSADQLADTETRFGLETITGGTDDANALMVENATEAGTPEPEPAKVYDFASIEQPAQFPGGEEALYKFLGDNIRYPVNAQENGIQGRVVVQFVVTKTGEVGEVKVIRSKDPDLDKEAIRVVKTLPNFIPGKQNGHPVNVWYTLPITFKLQGI
jgi:protein TonB